MVAEKTSKTGVKAPKEASEHKAAESKAVKAAPKSVKKEAITADPKAAADAWNILKYPYLTEKSTRMIESQNKLVFIVKDRSSKAQIKEAVEAVFGVKVADVNTTSTMRGEKKAYIRLKPEFKAVDIATKLGMM
ncbi:MAG: 50S ribosomal protein L23 [Nanoarchaeota archaeon]|nr:50S ribosomal protein L23 [Nanoarchaeota archaeon]MBU4452342.1 50S ribosomal protein L23 [Nanoarchaeota archaeon]